MELTVTGCGNDNDGGSKSSPTPSGTTTQAPSQHLPKQQEWPRGGQEQDKERKDLPGFKINDRSQGGFRDLWVVWTIKNHSSEKSDYSWNWEAVDSTGKRVANSTYVTEVQLGQTATGEDVTSLKTANAKLNITDFNRTKAH